MENNSSDHLKAKYLKIFIVLLILSNILFIVLYSTSKPNKTGHQNNNTVKADLYKLETKKSADLKSILKVDEWILMEQDYEKAKNQLDLLEVSVHQDFVVFVQSRQKALKELIQLNSDQDNGVEKVLAQKNQKIQQFKSKLDSLNNQFLSFKDSLEFKIEGLKIDLRKKEDKLATKEDVQVINFKNDKGKKIYYLGKVQNGKANGGGVGIFETGGMYKGEWKNNKRHGEGEYEWNDGSKYKGEYTNDIKKGNGTYYWPSGERYEGEWENDRRNGYGTYYDRDGNIKYEGEWENDKIAKN